MSEILTKLKPIDEAARVRPSDPEHLEPHNAGLRGRWRTLAVICGCYLMGAAAITWPLVKRFSTHLPQGTEPVETVPLFNAWTIWWNCFQLTEGFESYWTAPIFAPTEGTFTFSELQPTTLVVAPVWFVSRNLALSYNSYLFFNLWLNAVLGFWFCRRVGMSASAAFAGGGLVLCLPFVHWQLGVLQLVPLWPTLWLWGELASFTKPDHTASRWRIGLAFVTVYLACHHYGLFVALLLAVSGVVLVPCGLFRRRRFWLTLFLNGLLAAVLLAPIVWAQLHYLGRMDTARDIGLVTRLSAMWGDYTSTGPNSWFPAYHWADPNRAAGWPLSPGHFVWGLGAVGLLGGLFEKSRRRIVLFLGTVIIVSVVLSLGTHFQPGGFSLYERVIVRIPGFAQVRNIFRFVVFAQLAAALLAAAGLNLLVRAGHALKLHPCWALILVLAFNAAAVAETWPRSQKFTPFPDVRRHARWTDWLKDQARAGEFVANVPFSPGGAAEDYLITTRGMILGTEHHRQLVNGYSGYFPPSYRDLRRKGVDFPKPSAIDALRDAGVRYIVDLRRTELVPANLEWDQLFPEGIELVFYDSGTKVAIYRIPPPEPGAD